MWIDSDILLAWGGIVKKYSKNEFIFMEGEESRFYYQIMEGRIRMCCFNDDGKEFWQGEFHKGESFGEPPLFADEKYPANAVADTDCVILKVTKNTLYKLLNEYPEIQKKIIISLSKRIVKKTLMTKELVSHNPKYRILSFLDRYKKDTDNTQVQIQIPYTRQEIANFTGLRVETIIRTLKALDQEGIVKIKNRKVHY